MTYFNNIQLDQLGPPVLCWSMDVFGVFYFDPQGTPGPEQILPSDPAQRRTTTTTGQDRPLSDRHLSAF